MATVKRTKNDYIFEHPESRNLYVRLRSGDGRRYVQSLGTADRREAEVKAGPLITAHKAALLAARPRVETIFEREYAPGLHTGLNGERIFATETELHYLDGDGHTIRTEPNGVTVRRIVGGPLSAKGEFKAFDAAHDERPIVPKKNSDDAILDTYLNHRGIDGYDRREAETVWAKFKELTGNKSLRDADRNDGRKLVTYFQDQGNKSATITKKIGWLRAAVKLAIDEDKDGKLKFNPFSNIVPKGDDEQDRVPLDPADVKACKDNLDKLSDSDQLLFRLLATTGVRLSEAFQIDDEKIEQGVRYCIIGTKTDQSLRRLPFPTAVLPYLPKKIAGPMFGENTRTNHRAASKRLNRFLDECGIDDPAKVIHSLRHRAKDQMRAARCPWAVQEELFGRDKVTVGHDYGLGSPVPLLKEWIDKIGF